MFKRYISLLLSFVLLGTLLMPLTVSAQQTAESDTDSNGTFKSHFINLGGDPWVTYHDGWYYYMVTGNGFYVAKSRELERVNSNPVSVFALNDLKDGENLSIVKELWAPELHFIDGYWYIYFTAYDGEKSDSSEWNGCTGKPRNHRMYVLKSKSEDAQGEYEFLGQIKEIESDYINDSKYDSTTDKPGHWAIDQSVFTWNGKLYAVWSGWSGYDNIDQRIYIAEMSNPYTISGSRVELSRPEFAYETYSVVPAVNEAPQALISPDGKTLNIAFSVNRFDDPTYALGLLTLKENGNPLNADDWTKTENSVFSTNEESSTYSVGHCSFVQSPDKSEYYVIYHARRGEDVDTNPREIRTQQFFWNNDGTPEFGKAVNSADPIPVPSGTAAIVRTEAEAEQALLSGGAFVVDSNFADIPTYDDDYYSGGKRIAITQPDSSATFTYNAEKGGKHTLTLLASGNSNTKSGLAVTVNGTEYKAHIHGGMGNENIFAYYDLTGIELIKGENTIVVSYSDSFVNGAYLDRLDITNEADAESLWVSQDEANSNCTKTPTIIEKAPEKIEYPAYNTEYTFNSFGNFDKYWFSSQPFVDDPAYKDVITTCRAGGNKRLLLSGKGFRDIGDFKSSVEITPAAKHELSSTLTVIDETAINAGILFRIGKMTDYTTNVCTFDGYRVFLTVSGGVVKMQLSRYYFANDEAVSSTNKIIKTSVETLPYTPGDTYVIEVKCIGNRVDATAYNKNNPNTVITIENQSIETSVAETLESGRIGLFVNCTSRVAFSNMKLTSYDLLATHTQNYNSLTDYVVKSNVPDKQPSLTENGILTSTGALKMQALDSAITYKEKTFNDFYNIDNYDIYGNKYYTTSYKVSTYGATFDSENGIITTADAQSKLKLEGTEGMTDFTTEFTVTKLGTAKALYGGIAFRMQDSDFRTATFGTQGYMIFVNSAATSCDVKIYIRKYTTTAKFEEDIVTVSGLLGTATNGVDVKISVVGSTATVSVADAENAESTHTEELTLIPDSTNGDGTYYDSGSVAFVSNGNHTFENISLKGKVPTNYTTHEKNIYNLYDRNYYTLYGNTTGDDITDYNITFGEDRISTYGQSKIKINGYSNVEDFKASFDIKKTNGNALYGGIAFRIQDIFFEKAPFGTPGYMIFAYSAEDSMDLSLRLRNYSTASGYAYKEIKLEGFLAAPDNKSIRMEVEVIGDTLNVTVYDLSDLTRNQTATFSLTSNLVDSAKAGSFKGGSIAFVSNGTHDFSNISVSELVKEAPYTQVENFEAQADFKLPSSTNVQAGIMFYVGDTVNRTPGLTAFSLNAIRTSSSADNAMTLQLVRYGTKADGTKNSNIGGVTGSSKVVANILQTKNGADETVRVKIRVVKGILYYSLTNVATGVSSNTYSIALNSNSTSASVNYTTEYTSGGIGTFTNTKNITVSNFNVTKLADCVVTITDTTGGTTSGADTYAYSESVTVTATPDYGYYFGGWYNGTKLITSDESYTFTATESIILTPKYILFPLKFTGTDSNNIAAVINVETLENVTEIGFEVTAKSENNEITKVLSTKYINTSSAGKKPWISTSDKVYYCDINDDGTADSLDLAVLRKSLINGTVLSNVTADLNEDEKINLKDLVRFKKAEADVELIFDGMSEGYNYPFVFGNLLEGEGKEYIELKPYSITQGKKAYGVSRYLSFDGKVLTRSSTSENHTPFGKIRIACVGDSITQGIGATGWASGDYRYAYPQQLQTILGESCLVGNFGKGGAYVYNEGRTNTALYYPNTAEYTKSNSFDSDIVIIKLGTNDARVMSDESTSAGWKEYFNGLVNHYKNLESKPTVYIMSSITMKNYDEALETNLITHILPQQKAVAEELGCVFLDAYTELYDIFISGEGFASDKLHPNDTGYKAIAELVAENISLDIFY